ncbi:excisionase family DNA-binding protein [Shouchella shacheensis]|uniref:excisionase family DNA-binding protein n=1 Tax=Shouchella shacheensis TaxID=1649580 RepID=UPI0007403720|nr:excisionase family DNA-binding protein [Shouchella shacheensis]
MYISVNELAEYLGLQPAYIQKQIHLGHVHAVWDGEKLLLNKEQFQRHKEQLDAKRKQTLIEQDEPIPEDWDAQDED